MSLSAAQLELAASRGDGSRALLTGWADGFLKDYGFDWVDSLDYADFEGAGYQWNLNRPLTESRDARLNQLIGAIDLILDYGTSEHVFNPGMSFYNAACSLKVGGVLNSVLPVYGFGDHGMYQFNPSFFYALDRPDFKLEALYFFSQNDSPVELTYWNGLSQEFREHVHGAFDGSYAANCLQFLVGQPIRVWALYRKLGEIEQSDFLQNCQQLIYKQRWSRLQDAVSPNTGEKLETYNLTGPERSARFVDYINSISLKIKQI